MKSKKETNLTYVLFGQEAILVYKVSPRMLSNLDDIEYCVGAFSSVKLFVKESKLWDGFIEISKQDYKLLKKNSCKPKSTQRKKSFFDFLFSRS